MAATDIRLRGTDTFFFAMLREHVMCCFTFKKNKIKK